MPFIHWTCHSRLNTRRGKKVWGWCVFWLLSSLSSNGGVPLGIIRGREAPISKKPLRGDMGSDLQVRPLWEDRLFSGCLTLRTNLARYPGSRGDERRKRELLKWQGLQLYARCLVSVWSGFSWTNSLSDTADWAERLHSCGRCCILKRKHNIRL